MDQVDQLQVLYLQAVGDVPIPAMLPEHAATTMLELRRTFQLLPILVQSGGQ